MAQLKNDEWPAHRAPTTPEQQVGRDPLDGPTDPHDERGPGETHLGRDEVRRKAKRDTAAAEPKGRT